MGEPRPLPFRGNDLRETARLESVRRSREVAVTWVVPRRSLFCKVLDINCPEREIPDDDRPRTRANRTNRDTRARHGRRTDFTASRGSRGQRRCGGSRCD